MAEDFQVTLRDGRFLGGRWAGDLSKQRIVVYFHGFPGSRLEVMIGHKAALERGVTLLSFDRPGLGTSDFRESRLFDDVSTLLVEALDVLGVSIFDVIAVSGGTPYAVALTGQIPSRVRKCAFVSPLWNTGRSEHLEAMNLANRSMIRLAQFSPDIGCSVLRAMAWSWRAFPAFADVWFGAVLPAVDRKILLRKSVAPIMNQNLAEALSKGTRGVVAEFARFSAANWHLTADKIKLATRVWHGTADNYVPIIMARALAAELPHSSLTLIEGGGHFMMVDLLDAVLDWCIENPQATCEYPNADPR